MVVDSLLSICGREEEGGDNVVSHVLEQGACISQKNTYWDTKNNFLTAMEAVRGENVLFDQEEEKMEKVPGVQ